MITLLLVGGNSQRFLDAGYTHPKCLLPMPDYATMLEWVARSLPCRHVVVAGRERHRDEMEPGVYAAYRSMIPTDRIKTVWGADEAQGPLYGVLDARPHLDSIASLLIAYCDVIPLFSVGDAIHFWRKCGAESGAVVFRSSDPRFGYWDGRAITEKRVTSEYAVSGLFYFANAREAVRRAKAAAHPGAGIIHMLDSDTQMYEVSAHELLDLGTPEAYRAFMGEGIRA